MLVLSHKNAGPRTGVFFIYIFMLGLGFFSVHPLGSLGPQELNRVLFVNETGRDLVRLFARVGDDPWGPDLLGRKGLAFGSMVGIYLHYTTDAPLVDFLAVDRLGSVYSLENQSIQEDAPNVVQFNVRALDRRRQAPELVGVYVSNVTTRLFSYVFLASSQSANWGFDVLSDASMLEAGASRLLYIPRPWVEESWEILAMSRDYGMVQLTFKVGPQTEDVFLDIKPLDMN